MSSRPIEDLYDEYIALDSDEMTFEVNRSGEKAVDRGNKTFSEDAMEFLHNQVWGFIGARIMAHWKRTKRAPMNMRVTVKVEFGDPNQRS